MANWSAGQGDKTEGRLARGIPKVVFFWQQRRRETAKLSSSIKIYWRRPSWALLGVGVLRGVREGEIKWRLETIHPNPGPRDKTAEGLRSRRERRYKKRKEKRSANDKTKEHLDIITWNVQRMSLGTFNKRKAKSVATIAEKNNWDSVLLSEVRASRNGVEWLGENDNLTAIIHSTRAGILLRGELLKLWCKEGQKKRQDERTVSVKMDRTVLVSTYQPVYVGNNEAEIEEAKQILLQHKQWAAREDILVIGGDFNAHIGGGENRPGICGRFGIRQSNHQGLDLLAWCEENDLAHVNSFYSHKKRGTWFHPALGRWYELDGFLMRQEQRHANVKKVSTVGESSISDHKPKKLTLVRKWKKYNSEEKKARIPRIKWESLRNEETELRYRQKVTELLENQTEENREQTNWQKIADTVTKAALEVCGREEKRIENPWMVDKDDEVQRMRARINRAIERRNTLTEQRRTGAAAEDDLDVNIAASIEELKEARKELKRETRRWELEWWEEILTNCENAGERGDTFEVYKNLKKLGGRGLTKVANTTNLTKEEFKEHFQKVSKDRFENTPEEIDEIIEEIEDISQTDEAKIWSEQLDEIPQREEIVEQMKKMKDSAPGEDGVRLSYLTKGGPEILQELIELIQFMFCNSAEKWEASLKIGMVIPLFKKGDIDNPGNYRGICLLSIASRILARILANRLRIWVEQLNLLDDNQSGFRKDRSTADATQIMIRIQEDTDDLRKRITAEGGVIEEDEMPVAKLLDLSKAYPRVNRPALWKILQRYGMGERCLRVLQDLHETTHYKIKSREGTSSSWAPERGLKEGCPSSPILFNAFHQPVMRIARRERKRKADEMGMEMGIPFMFVPGNSFPGNRSEKPNSEAKRVRIDLSLFADDTTVVGRKKELVEGLKITKDIMSKFEEKNNDDKEEELVFGTEEGEKIRMLGSYIGNKEDIKQRIKRANGAWAKTKRRLKGSKLSKKMQARIVEACVESTLLFDCQVRTWQIGEMKQLQKTMDRMYRNIWSKKNGPPLIQMQNEQKNMQDIRNELGVKSVRLKIEKRVLERIGHVIRMKDNRMVKAATLGWLEDLEDKEKLPGKKRKTILYWRKIIKEAGVDYTKLGQLASDRKIWKQIVRKRSENLETWERRGGKRSSEERGERNKAVEESLTCDYEGCGVVFLSKAGLTIHTKRIHEISENKVKFKCDRCDTNFELKSALVNHNRGCGGLRASSNDLRKCDKCLTEVTKSNFARHRKSCRNGEEEDQPRQPRPRGDRKACDICGLEQSKSNLARHKKKCQEGAAVPM